MRMIIDIPEEIYEKAKEMPDVASDSEWLAIKYGEPLPKGCGRLVDADEVDNNIYALTRSKDLNYSEIITVLNDANTIIEADSEV